MSTYGKLNLLPIISSFLVFSSQEMQRRLIQIKVYYKLFYSVSKEASHKPLNIAPAKKSLPSVFIIDTTCFDECLLSNFFTQIYCYPDAWLQPPYAAFVETSVLKEVHILCPFSPQ